MDELLETNLPEPHHHVAAPSPEVLPAPSKLSTTSEPQTEGQSSSQSTCKTSSPTRQIKIPFLEPIVNLDR